MYYKLAPIAHVLSRLGFVFSLLLLAPTLVSYLYQDAAFWVFADTAAATTDATINGLPVGEAERLRQILSERGEQRMAGL